jgi:hypothetical protein
MGSWQAQMGRITLFPLLGQVRFPLSALDLYKAVTGKDPDNFQNQQPPLNPFPNSVAQGNMQGLAFSCQVQPVRVDLTFSPGPTPTPFSNGLPAISDSRLLRAALASSIPSIEKAVRGAKLSRLAIYLQIGREVATSTEGNQFIRETLPPTYSVPLQDEEDFVLQLNRPSAAANDSSMRLNYITKWSVDRLQVLTFLAAQNSPIAGQFTAGAPVISNKLAATIALDNSSPAQNSQIDDNQIGTLLSLTFNHFNKQLKECNVSLEGFEDASV